MQILGESVVRPEEIDSLGHMNVRFYMARMEQANRTLLTELGVASAVVESAQLRRTDTYTRFRREQFEGARLHAAGGFLGAVEGAMRSFVEIRNADSEEVAATFIVTTAVTDRETRKILPVRPPANVATVDIPQYSQPRSLNLDVVNRDAALEQLEANIPEVEHSAMMSGRRETVIESGDVDATGFLREDIELMFLPFHKQAAATGEQPGPPVFKSGGHRYGWAVLETRNMNFAQPMLGDELAYFNADIELHEKTRLSRRWAFNKQTGQLLGTSDTVGICVDLDARKAMPWPEELRKLIEPHLRPALA